GYQISYDAFFSQALSARLATQPPAEPSTKITAPAANRGLPNFFDRIPESARAPSILDSPLGALEKNFRKPYTERWSFGFERLLSRKIVGEGSYGGTESHRLTIFEDANPRQLDGQYLHPDFGPRTIHTSQGNSSYHAMQWRFDRRFARGFQLNASYTWSKNLDSNSEGVGRPGDQALVQTPGNNL